MIQANELRIGNWIRYRDKKDCIVSNIGSSRFETVANDSLLPYGSDDLEEYNPIQLSQEWLVRFGFKKIIHSIKGTELKDEYEKGFVRISHYIGQFDFHGSTNLKHVHQLQNLYFALTGQELKLTEK